MVPDERENLRELTPTDLRGVLKYVPQWRNHIFVIAIDGSVVAEENFGNIMLELAVLRNLSIRLVVIHGIGAQLRRLAEQNGVEISDARGYGPTDKATLELAVEAAAEVGHKLTQGLTRMGLKVATTNAVRATERGIIKGIDQQFTGKVERIDEATLRNLIDQEIVPVISPIAFTKDGDPLRLNSDLLASRIAIELQASKLIYLLPYPGLTYNGKFRLNAPVDEVRAKLAEDPCPVDEEIRSKAEYAVRTIDRGVPRAHLIDIRIHDGILMEVFSKVGIGSMIHSNPYAQIRRARSKDVTALFNITKGAVRDDALRPRSRESIEKAIEEYYVYEVDESVIACFRLSEFPDSKLLEIGSVYVQPAYQGRNIGKSLVDYAVEEARRRKAEGIIALTTQAVPFFKHTCGFPEATIEDLPEPLQATLSATGRQSRIFLLPLKD
jgi:amino-acid N-acetyltransferase